MLFLFYFYYIKGANTLNTERPSLRAKETFLHSSRVISWLSCWVLKKSSLPPQRCLSDTSMQHTQNADTNCGNPD